MFIKNDLALAQIRIQNSFNPFTGFMVREWRCCFIFG